MLAGLFARRPLRRPSIVCAAQDCRWTGPFRARAAGLEVEQGVGQDPARRLNEAWFHWVETGRPFFHVKVAQTLSAHMTRGARGAQGMHLRGHRPDLARAGGEPAEEDDEDADRDERAVAGDDEAHPALRVSGAEECDDANEVETDACLSNCSLASCGDGFVRPGVESCDDAATDNNGACLVDCTFARCGDGYCARSCENERTCPADCAPQP